MLIWLLFLSALAIVSHQQFRRLRQPFLLPTTQHYALPNYRRNHYEFIDDNAGQLTPTQQITGLVIGDDPEIRMEDERIINRPNVRFLFYDPDNHFFKTATITFTSSQDVTRVQSCIPVDRFDDLNSISIVCKRKKREILQDSYVQPSQPQQPLMTILPVVGQLERGTRHLLDDPDLLISSSKDDVLIGVDESGNQDYRKKQKRFYYPFVATTTVHSFVLNSFTITKTVRLAFPGQLICRPSEFVVCST